MEPRRPAGHPRRIHVIGGPGTGKSTLAAALGVRHGLPVHHLDEVAYEGLEFVERPCDACRSEAERIAGGAEWVSEGIFVGWTEPLLERAEEIVWLDFAEWRHAALRIVRRTARGAMHEAKTRRGRERFFRVRDYRRNARQLIVVLRTSREYWGGEATSGKRRYPVHRSDVERALAAHAKKITRLTHSNQIGAYLNSHG